MTLDQTAVFAIQCFVALFIIIEPLGNVPIFLSLLEKFTQKERRAMIRNAVLIAALLLIIFTVLGRLVFNFLGIDIYSFKIAGGVLLFIIAIEMLFGKKSRTAYSQTMQEEVDEKTNLTVTPLAVPLLTGPGAITTSIVLSNSAHLLIDKIALIACIIVVFILTYLILSRADIVYRILGETGTKVFVRIMGLMLSAIAVQFIVDGLREALLI